eukprot:12925244-Prorocentrum_lima.AAC.1
MGCQPNAGSPEQFLRARRTAQRSLAQRRGPQKMLRDGFTGKQLASNAHASAAAAPNGVAACCASC